ncbi:hypothetical protein Lser_V15G01916 [Lactuca serriola]
MNFRNFSLLVTAAAVLDGVVQVAHSYNRPPPRESLVVSPAKNADPTTPQQIHISLVGEDRMRISWITDMDTPATVYYGTSSGNYQNSANGTVSSYEIFHYKSGKIHDVVIDPLDHSTVYYYCFTPGSTSEFSFKTPPKRFPIKFAVSGDLGQTEWTKSTLEHISQSNYDLLLLPGDLSYADALQPLWDSFGRLVEPLASRRPWMVAQGDHDIEILPDFHQIPFTSYNARWRMPYEESGSTSNLYYSFEVSKVHIIMLNSYIEFDHGSIQYRWLESDLKKVNRSKTPWLIVVVHAPWYNSYTAHHDEPESVYMRKSMEELLFHHRVDIVFAGHVHVYELFNRVYQEKITICSPLHITIGDGGNKDLLGGMFIDPPSEISAFRETSFGHGEFHVASESYAMWSWHRNDNDESVQSDSLFIQSLATDPLCNKIIAKKPKVTKITTKIADELCDLRFDLPVCEGTSC